MTKPPLRSVGARSTSVGSNPAFQPEGERWSANAGAADEDGLSCHAGLAYRAARAATMSTMKRTLGSIRGAF